jgi:hypothetical protein
MAGAEECALQNSREQKTFVRQQKKKRFRTALNFDSD